MEDRLKRVREKFDEFGIDGLLVSNIFNRKYLTGFTGTHGYVLIDKRKGFIITDFRYLEQAKEQSKDFEVINQGKDLYQTLKDLLEDLNIKRLGFEEEYLTYNEYSKFKEKFRNISLLPFQKAIQQIRAVKDKYEINKIKEAVALAEKAFSYILEIIRPGISEKNVAIELEFFVKRNGASGLAFETIVASGFRSSMPHGVASEKIIQYGEPIVLDFGCVVSEYCSDITRTVFVGKPDEKIKEFYEIVLDAQKNAFDVLKPGIGCKDVDEAGRKIIRDKGYGDNFGHGLGHGVGLEVHEEPTLSVRSENILKPGMVLTIEPGVYMEGVGGVRIEDMVLITEEGYENLVSFPKDIIVV